MLGDGGQYGGRREFSKALRRLPEVLVSFLERRVLDEPFPVRHYEEVGGKAREHSVDVCVSVSSEFQKRYFKGLAHVLRVRAPIYLCTQIRRHFTGIGAGVVRCSVVWLLLSP